MKLQYFGHVTRASVGNLALTVLEGSVDGLRHQGRPKRQWMDDIEEWSGCSYIQLKEIIIIIIIPGQCSWCCHHAVAALREFTLVHAVSAARRQVAADLWTKPIGRLES